MDKQKSSQRFFYLDYLRAFSTIGIVIIHVTQPIIFNQQIFLSATWWVAYALGVLFHASVPLFVLISGALVLNVSQVLSPWNFYKKRLWRITPPALAYIGVYCIWSLYSGQIADLKTYVIRLFVYGTPYVHLYFIYVILGLYLFAPWLQILISQLNRKQFKTLVITLLALTAYWEFTTIWFTNNFSGMYVFAVTMFVPYIGYFISGSFMHSHSIKISNSKLWMLLLLMTIGIMIQQYVFLENFGNTPRGLIPRSYHAPLLIIQALLIFSVFKVMRPPKSQVINKLAKYISNASYGIFLSHIVVIELLFGRFPEWSQSPTLGSLALTFFVTLIASYTISSLLNRIPAIRVFSGMERVQKLPTTTSSHKL